MPKDELQTQWAKRWQSKEDALQEWYDEKMQEIEAQRQDMIDSGILESLVNLHHKTTPENRAVIKNVITLCNLNEEANEIVRKSHRK